MPTPPKFVQIAVSPSTEEASYALYALDEAGVVWIYDDDSSNRLEWRWWPLPDARHEGPVPDPQKETP